MKAYIHAHTYMQYTHACIYMYIYTYIHTYLPTYLHTYIHTHTRTDIYRYAPAYNYVSV